MQDVSYAADASATSAMPIANASTTVRNKWQELDYAGLADAMGRRRAAADAVQQPRHRQGRPAKLRDLGRKVIVHTGLADDAIPPAGNVNYHERVLAAMGGHAEVQKFMRMYLVPGVGA